MNNNCIENILKQSLAESLELELAEWTKMDKSEQYAVPKKAYYRMRRKVRHAEYIHKYGKVLPVLARVAIYLLIIIGIASALTVVTVAIHKQRIFAKPSEDGTFMKMRMLEEDPVEEKTAETIQLAYIPEGYELVSEEANLLSLSSIYENENGSSFRINREIGTDTELNIDAEKQEISQVLINGYEGYLFKNDINTIVIWTNLIGSYKIFGFEMGDEEVIKIAENAE